MTDSNHRIENFDQLPPFFMTLVSSSDIWAFLSSTGGITAGRQKADYALFPYYTDDRVSENAHNTGPLTLIRLPSGECWQPFSGEIPSAHPRVRTLFKSVAGDKITFREVRPDLGLCFEYTWCGSPRFGLVRKVVLHNQSESPVSLELLDGVQNLLPADTTRQLQNEFSNLLDAYKRSTLESPGTLALYTLSSLLTDLAEPSEALRATTAWSCGLDVRETLLSPDQIPAFLRQEPLQTETDVRARRGAFLLSTSLTLQPGETAEWFQVFDVRQDHASVVELQALLADPGAARQSLIDDIQAGTGSLLQKMSAADALQFTGDVSASSHHFSNVVFNCMRGGLFPDGPRIQKNDLHTYLKTWHHGSEDAVDELFPEETEHLSLLEFRKRLPGLTSPDARRLCGQYLPLTFSRRHGDPSRPWNTFHINVTREDGSPRLDYQGNWRDFFQNLEALLLSCPPFIPQAVSCFLNATTEDGYNPYRVTRSGIEWEKPEPENPWSNIGYWGDHQIIYLLKLLEARESIQPGELIKTLNAPLFSHADVPYRILPYDELCARDDGTTVLFDAGQDQLIERRVASVGADGKMVHDAEGKIVQVSLLEKLLILTLAKLGNFVPDAGIWMNTQRPEWNDANNALAGRGLSVVTLGYLHRWLLFIQSRLQEDVREHYGFTPRVAEWLEETAKILSTPPPSPCDDRTRRQVMNRLGRAASEYRKQVYERLPNVGTRSVPRGDLIQFVEQALRITAASLRANRRADGMYHAYHVLEFTGPDQASVRNLDLMLEGQVSVLSSGILPADEAADLLTALRQSDLYREDQHSYMLYPNRIPPRFMDKNQVSASAVTGIPFLAGLARKNNSLIRRNVNGVFHFHPDLRNARDVETCLDTLAADPAWSEAVRRDRTAVLALYEQTFNHRTFTGRSGSMFGYEGLGSIYWHMVAKLLLAVQETCLSAEACGADPGLLQKLRAAYTDVRNGLGFRKTPEQFGAFPTDPYSHTPMGGGAKQPGMTGQVKEEILTRLGELGLRFRKGRIHFSCGLTPREDWRTEAGTFHWRDITGAEHVTEVPAKAYAFTCCGVLILIRQTESSGIGIQFADGTAENLNTLILPEKWSRSLFSLTGEISALIVSVNANSR
ncbi:MAG: hypothetical protein JJU05_00355 [Verrucomicrobia bacterium]|nr:hypothetical protein [Verrucomicrobiota bacterium]MCH8526278.1 hypothetical protein [Kiritimatiellia bacterium]